MLPARATNQGKIMIIKILNDANAVLPYLGEIAALADSNKQALGFMPESAYENAIYKKNILVALMRENGGESFAGHLFLGGRHPEKKIYQIVVAEKQRQKGIAGALLRKGVNFAKSAKYSIISAKVGETLPANEFWRKQGFSLVGTTKGKSTHPVCRIWQKNIAPSLWGAGIEGVRSGNLYIVDTNVFIDAASQQNSVGRFVFISAGRGEIRLARTPETTGELLKFKGNGKPALRLALKYPELTGSPDNNVTETLRQIIFPGKHLIRESDELDLKCLSVAIAAGAAGFITQDKAILQKHADINLQFPLDILSPADMWDWEMATQPGGGVGSVADMSGTVFSVVKNPDNAALKNAGFDGAIGGNPSFRAALMDEEKMLAVVVAGKLDAAASKQKISLFLAESGAEEQAANMILGWFSQNFDKDASIELELHGGELAKSAVIARGYAHDEGKGNVYRKTHVPRAIIKNNWAAYRSDVNRLGGILLPEQIPNFRWRMQPVEIGEGRTVPLNKLEDYLSSVFVLPGRCGVAFPIKPWFAEEFLGSAGQQPLLPPAAAQWLGHKSYLGSVTSRSRVQAGMPLLFYQSAAEKNKEPGRIVAVARVQRVQIWRKNRIPDDTKRRLVLTEKDIAKMGKWVMETVFVNCVILPKPVTLNTLRRIQCHDPADFITTTRMPYDKVRKILKEGKV